MKIKILGWIATIWGGLILINSIVKLCTTGFGDGAYGVGQLVAVVFGGILLIAGIRSLRKVN